MLTVVTPATNFRLTTVSNLRSDLNLASSDFSDATLERRIDEATSLIETYCGRIFARQTYRETFGANAGGEYALVLGRDPVQSVTSVGVDGALYPLDEYVIEGISLYRLNGVARRTYWSFGPTDVLYVAGYVLPGDTEQTGIKLPAFLQRCCTTEISAMISMSGRDLTIKSENVEGVGSTTFHGSANGSAGGFHAPGMASMLDQFRDVRI